MVSIATVRHAQRFLPFQPFLIIFIKSNIMQFVIFIYVLRLALTQAHKLHAHTLAFRRYKRSFYKL